MLKVVAGRFLEQVKIYRHIAQFRSQNRHNETVPVNIFPIKKVSVGNHSYGEIYLTDHSDLDVTLKIGNYCSIAPGVKFLLAGEHNTNTASTFPFKAKFRLVKNEAASRGSIIIHDDVWIGANSLILSGVQIGRGAVIAGGSVVTKDVPPYAVVGGNPAKVLRFRHSEEVIQHISKIDFSRLSREVIMENLEFFYEPLTEKDSSSVIEMLEKRNLIS